MNSHVPSHAPSLPLLCSVNLTRGINLHKGNWSEWHARSTRVSLPTANVHPKGSTSRVREKSSFILSRQQKSLAVGRFLDVHCVAVSLYSYLVSPVLDALVLYFLYRVSPYHIRKRSLIVRLPRVNNSKISDNRSKNQSEIGKYKKKIVFIRKKLKFQR